MDINQTLDALISKVQSAPSTASSTSSSGPASNNVESPLDGYVCDENGCVLVAPKAPSRSAPEDSSDGPVLEELLSGCDWSLGMRTDMDPDGYCAVVGGSEWEVSMTAQELRDFVTALKAIRAALNALIAKQPDSPSPLRAKWDLRTVIMEATANPSAQQDDFQLTFMIGAGGLRAITGRWSRSTVADVMRTLDAQLPGFAPAGAAGAAAASPAQQQAPATAAAR